MNFAFPTIPTMNDTLIEKLRTACSKSPIPTDEEAIELMPEIGPEVWNTQKPDPEKCIRAVRAMCS